ncbi:TIGR03546 family protein [Venatoribacter cucullus]|uniref:TIGR03546 family protein n=1 Tax=Venatoribacter cucullus TaxID=2661630 RepID=A0A9E8FR01_9GAMM|nr:TIGR03546 family protein [Venatoribacter cucullus]QQD21020.1 TIGR03546 family protein [Oceanospirillaceae bacterium ASx5O]QQD23803.1 TIGR03546 family protein [Venatoribacter cucullus]UZK03201.1 TIGR03546 family protein [Venatoribacter cucullus]
MLSMLAKLLKALNSEAQPGQIALALALALIVALTPTFSLHNLLILLLALVLRTNLSAFFVGFAGFSAIAWLADPYLAGLGETLLTHPALQETWTALYQNDFWRMTAFNHTLVLGGLAAGLVAFVPVLLLSRWLVVQYRERLLAWVNRFRVAQLLKGSKFYRLYQSLAE